MTSLVTREFHCWEERRWFWSQSSRIMIILLSLSVLGCDSLTLQEDPAGAGGTSFYGIASAEILSTNDTIVLNWSPPSEIDNGTPVQYKLYLQELSAAEANSGISLASERKSSNLSLGNRSGKLIDPTDTLNPATTGRLVKVLSDGELSYEIGSILPTAGYAFQVVAYINQKPSDEKTQACLF